MIKAHLIRMMKTSRGQCAVVLGALFCVQMVMHLNVDNILLDDWAFFGVLDGGESVLAFLRMRWETWSSRLIIEGILAWITHSIWTFRVLDSAVMVLMAWSMCRLADAEDRPECLILSAALVTTIPFYILRSTGWMATSLNYYWPLAATFVALIPLADALWERKTQRVMLLFSFICAVFGANQEQTSAVIMGSYLVLGAFIMIKRRCMMPALVALLAIGMAQLTMHLLAPGNNVRAGQETAYVNLRDYGQFSLIDKLSIGLTSTTALLFFTYNPMLLCCGAGIVGSMIARRRNVLCLLPAVLVLAVHMGKQMLSSAEISGDAVTALMEYGSYVLQLGPQRIQWKGQMDMMFLIVVMLGLMALTLYLSIGHRPLSAVCIFVFAIGFAARMALSFSPTVVESGERTMIPLYGAMMLCTMLCTRDLSRENGRKWPYWMAVLTSMAFAGMNFLQSFALAA